MDVVDCVVGEDVVVLELQAVTTSPRQSVALVSARLVRTVLIGLPFRRRLETRTGPNPPLSHLKREGRAERTGPARISPDAHAHKTPRRLLHDARVPTVIAFVAQYAVFVVPAGALLVWWRAGRRDKVALAVAAVVTIVLAGIGIELAALLWTDPRPFVADGQTALVAHAADNGFPSDHTTLAAAVAAVVLAWRRRVGVALLVVAAAVGAARVAAHIHHVPDVLAGAAIGVACAVVGVVVARRCVAWAAARHGATPTAAV